MGGFNWSEIVMESDNTGGGGGGGGMSCSSLLLRLPPELLAYILSFLSGREIAIAARVCKAFYQASQIESVWQNRCLREYNIEFPPHSKISCMAFYTKILRKFGQLIGLWRTNITSYGGLLQVKFESERLVGIEWHPPPHPNVKDPLRRKDLFSIELTPDNQQVLILCQKGSVGPHSCFIDMKQKSSFYSKCCNPENHNYSANERQKFREWSSEETQINPELNNNLKELLLMKFIMIHEYKNAFQHRRLSTPICPPDAIIHPGLFKGTYSAHGVELIMLTYEESGTKVKAVKITGDPNVPSGNITFQCDLRYPIILTEENQRSFTDLQCQEAVSSPIPSGQFPPQPFHVPQDCIVRDQQMHLVPRTCKARYFARGQIAGHGFTNPSFIAGHWIIYNDDLFGFLWFDLLSLSLFHRVLEPIS